MGIGTTREANADDYYHVLRARFLVLLTGLQSRVDPHIVVKFRVKRTSTSTKSPARRRGGRSRRQVDSATQDENSTSTYC